MLIAATIAFASAVSTAPPVDVRDAIKRAAMEKRAEKLGPPATATQVAHALGDGRDGDGADGGGGDGQTVVFGALDGAVNRDGELVFSGDGSCVASAGRDGAVVVDAGTGKTLRQVRVACDHAALSQRGERLACAGRVIDVDTGNDVTPDDGVHAYARSADGKVALAAAADNAGVIVVVNNGKRFALHSEALDKRARDNSSYASEQQYRSSIAVGGAFVVVGLDGGGAALFRASDGGYIGVVAKDFPRGGRVVVAAKTAVAVAPSGLVVFDATTAKELRRVELKGEHGGSIDFANVLLAADGKTAVVLDQRALIVVDVVAGEALRTIALAGGAGSSTAKAALSPDAKVVAAVDYDRPLRRFSTTSGKELAMADRHAGAVTAAAFSADGSRVVTLAQDGVRVWRSDGALVHLEAGVGGGGGAATLAMPDAHTVLVVGGGAAKIVEAANGAWTVSGSASDVVRGRGRALADGKTAWVSNDEALERIDVNTGVVVESLGRNGALRDVNFDVDDRGRLLIAERTGALRFGPSGRMIDVKLEAAENSAGKPVDKLAEAMAHIRAAQVRVSNDGAWLATRLEGARTWRVASTRGGKAVDVEGASLAFVPHTAELIVAAGDELRVIRCSDGAVVAAAHTGRDAAILAVSDDGKRVALGAGIQLVVAPLPAESRR